MCVCWEAVAAILSKFQKDSCETLRGSIFNKVSVPIFEVSQQKQILENCDRNLFNVQAEQTTPTFLKFNLAGSRQ